MNSIRPAALSAWALTGLLLSSLPASAALSGVADVTSAPTGLSFQVLRPHGGVTLGVRGPFGYQTFHFFEAGEAVGFDARAEDGGPLRDGIYTFEIRLLPTEDRLPRELLQRARSSEETVLAEDLRAQGELPKEAAHASGSFTVLGGEIADPGRAEAGNLSPSAATASATPGSLTTVHGHDQVIADDIIGKRSLCVGFDCVDGEDFGTDTIRLEENVLRIHFDDTSDEAAFPDNDWRLSANDQFNGGANYFALEDVTAGTRPFTVEAGAGNDALFLQDNGNLGLGTSFPVRSLHPVRGDSPGIRLQQDGSGGYDPQTWEVVGNETNFFISDISHGSTLPFRIRPGADTNAFVIADDSQIGMGTFAPEAALHVRGNDGATGLMVEETTFNEAARVMATLKNNGRVLWTMEDTSANGTIWRFRTVEGQFNFDSDLGAGNEFTLDSGGNLTILGTLTENSNREAKTSIQAIDPEEVLDKVTRLPINTWVYKKQLDVTHLGPMAQDFHQLFGLGAGNVGITTYDTAGVALASIQALVRRVEQQEEELAAKDSRIAALEQTVEQSQEKAARIEALLRRVEALERASGFDLSVPAVP